MQQRLGSLRFPTRPASFEPYAYDQLGRLLSAKDYNLEASYLLEGANPRAITRSYSYDPLGRALTERQVIAEGSQTLQDETVQRAFTALGNAGLWQERTTYPSGTVWEREFAQGGRLRHAERVSRQGGRSSAEIEVDWVGELYAGRRQQYDSNVEPIVERKAFDGLGRVQQWEYRAVSLDAQGNPTSSGPWPKAYCHGSWQSDCELPLYATSLRYDTMNRLRGVTRRFGHPVVEQGQLRSASEHKRAWRGYDYSHRGFLSHEWQGEELSNEAAFNVIANHSDPQHSDHDAVAAASQGKQWLWERNETGDLEEIRAGARHKGASRWAHTNTQTQDARRTARHKLDQVETPALGPVTVEHDERGRVALDAGFEYEHGADDRLLQAEERPGTGGGSGREIYFYDGRGELAQVVRQSAPGLAGEEHFVYDGVHKVASYQDGQLKWEAFFGAGLDRLLLLDDVQGGEDYVTLGDERRNVIGMWKSSSKQLEGLARYSAQGHRTTLAPNGVVECDEEAYGAAVCEQHFGVMPFGFNSAWRSPMTGLSQMRHRWYSPGLNQFLSHDPLEHIDSYNLYAFAGHDPVNFRDPFGLEKGGLLDMARRFGSRVMDWFGSDTGQKVMAVGVGLVNIGMGTAEIFVGVGATMTGAGALAGVPIAAIGADTLITGLETLMTGQIQKTMVEEVATEAALAAGAEPETAETLGALADVASGVATLGTNKAATHLARRSAQRLAAKNAGKEGAEKLGKESLENAGKGAAKEPLPKSAPLDGAKCFVAGTAVLLATGAFNPIEQLEVQAQVAPQERPLEEQAWRLIQGPSGRVEVAPGVKLTLKRGEVIEVSLAAHREPERERWQSLKASRYVPGSLHATDITPALWRRLELVLERPDGSFAEVELIRPLWWLEQTGAVQGGTIHLEVTEAGLEGRARVVSLSDDVTVDSRTAYGAIVMATIRHENASVIELVLDGDEANALGVTPNHPLYSADRDAWVPAGEFEVGEHVETQDGVTATVTSIRDEGRRETVYNLEVYRAQTYHVGEQRLLAHNTGAACRDLSNWIPKTPNDMGTRGLGDLVGWTKGSAKKHSVSGTPIEAQQKLLSDTDVLIDQLTPTRLGEFRNAGLTKEMAQSWANFYQHQNKLNPVMSGVKTGNINALPRQKYMQAIADGL